MRRLSPDHLDRHGGMGGYFAAKRRLFAEGGPDRAVIGIDEAEGAFLAGQLAEGPSDDRVIRVSVARKLTGSGWQVFARKGFLSEYRKGRQAGSIDLREIKGLPGAHNHQNACCAWAVARALGIAPRTIGEAFSTFDGLPPPLLLPWLRAGRLFPGRNAYAWPPGRPVHRGWPRRRKSPDAQSTEFPDRACTPIGVPAGYDQALPGSPIGSLSTFASSYYLLPRR